MPVSQIVLDSLDHLKYGDHVSEPVRKLVDRLAKPIWVYRTARSHKSNKFNAALAKGATKRMSRAEWQIFLACKEFVEEVERAASSSIT